MHSDTLIFGASWAPDEERRALNILWAKLLDKLSPECDILVIDCNSPFRPGAFLKPLGYETLTSRIKGSLHDLRPFQSDEPGRWVWSFPTNIGHLSSSGKDGWGRSFSKGIEVAIKSGYKWLAYVEPDCLLSEPVGKIISKMEKNGVKVACPFEPDCHFSAHEISFYNVEYLAKTKFVERYDWQTSRLWTTETRDAYRPPEKRWEEIFSDELFFLPLRGCRNGRGMITAQNIEQVYLMGLEWITHCRDFQVYEEFLKRNRIEL